MDENHPSLHELSIPDLIEEIDGADDAAVLRTLAPLHPADRAALLVRLEEEPRLRIFSLLDSEERAEVLEHLPEEMAASLAESLTSDELADVLDEMPPNLAADILGDLTEEQASPVLAEMEDADSVRSLLEHEDDTAGGLMTPDFVAVRAQMSVSATIEFLRQARPESTAAYYLYALDDQKRLVGIVGLRDLIVAPPHCLISQIMSSDVFSVPEGTDQEEVAQLMTKYKLSALPVVDEDRLITGVITSEELVQVIEEEATEDMYRLSNLSDSELQIWSPLPMMISRRLPWLYLNLLTAFLAAWVVSLFEGTITKLAILASFQGIVAGQGGNAGTQVLAMMVRSIALGEIRFSDIKQALKREIFIGLVNGIATGTAVGLIAWIWKGLPVLGVATGLALVGNMVAAGIAGTLVPLSLKALKADPALASAVIVTTVTDCIGFGLFLGLCTYLLPLM